MNSPASVSGLKRPRPSSDELPSPQPLTQPDLASTAVPSPPSLLTSASSSFRNVSACNRCRLRKNRCDQQLPACQSCSKAGVKCVGYDPITKRAIPRSYVYYLESRIFYLESLLQSNEVPFNPPEAFNLNSRPSVDPGAGQTPTEEHSSSLNGSKTNAGTNVDGSPTSREHSERENAWEKEKKESEKLNKLVDNVGMVSVQGASDPRYLGSTSGISFARVVFAAVKSSVSGASSERGGVRPSKPMSGGAAATDGTSMRDSFFGLHTKPTIKPAPFPEKALGLKLVDLYFEHANPQIPILHRGEYMDMFNRTYATEEKSRTSREKYMLNIVFAMGAGIIWTNSMPDEESELSRSDAKRHHSPMRSSSKRQRLGHQCQPEEYHASAIVHLESFLGSSPAADRPDGFGGGLEELQAVLLLAGFALLRPVAPGLWYIIGVAVRLGVDLGLHYEDGTGIQGSNGDNIGLGRSESTHMSQSSGDQQSSRPSLIDPKERGRREWVRDLRRRLWWCVYSFDRLVSTCVGRPFGITDQVVTTEFPSLLDDSYITTSGFLAPPSGLESPSYKHVAHHYFRLRLLQSEILQVLQYQQAQHARANGANRGNRYMHTKIPSPFLQNFDSFRSWRIDIDRRLWEWKESAPTKAQIGVQFSIEFLELNYWQAVIMLYRQSVSVPPMLENELGPPDDVSSPSILNFEEREDEERVFLKVAEAGQKVLRLYRQLHRVHLVNYTFLATHHLFMAGISFLYAIWHSSLVRSQLSMDDVDFTVLAATSVLGDLIEKCPPAEACRDAFDRMSKATVQMCLSTTGFGSQASGLDSRRTAQTYPAEGDAGYSSQEPTSSYSTLQNKQNYLGPPSYGPRRPPHKFDMNLDGLFPVEDNGVRSSNQSNDDDQYSPISDRILKQENSSYYSPTDRTSARYHNDYGAGNQNIEAAIDPSLQQQQQQQLPQQFHSVQVYPQSSYPDAGFQGMDFLDNGVRNSSSSGLDLGFGLGMDGDHDWSDGTQYDLFDGFFFGGSGAGM
ncbi:MAG: Fungal specific transcription factor [Pycnora praestabilis]|nr:MAG: Fungal specific transcription factor [Pycnora praestabilis]